MARRMARWRWPAAYLDSTRLMSTPEFVTIVASVNMNAMAERIANNTMDFVICTTSPDPVRKS